LVCDKSKKAQKKSSKDKKNQNCNWGDSQGVGEGTQ